ncbi:MAG: hypothetical protein DME21_05020 [Verrucomicrobia bacterium]|nr:MAG: hypothetical protein DME21_05020 [Verrucomicrobiota bacterium]
MKFPRHARIFCGQLDASPFVGVLFLVAIFLLLNSSLVFLPGVPIDLPEAADLSGVTGRPIAVAVDRNGRFYFRNQLINTNELQLELHKAVRESKEPPPLVLMVDKSVPYDTIMNVLAGLAREAGVRKAWLVARPLMAPTRTNAAR